MDPSPGPEHIPEDHFPAESRPAESELPANIFSHCSPAFLEAVSDRDRTEIVQDLQTVKDTTDQNNGALAIATNHPGGITFGMSDSRFIIETVQACCRREGIEGFEIIPVLVKRQDEANLALCHVEISGAGADKTKRLALSLEKALQDLQLATSDFSEMADITTALSNIKVDTPSSLTETTFQPAEVSSFLKWLEKKNFVFLGYNVWSVGENNRLKEAGGMRLGIFNSRSDYLPTLVREVQEDARAVAEGDDPIWLTRLSVESPVRRENRLIHIAVKERDEEGLKVHSLVGLLSDSGEAAETSKMPLVRQKLRKIRAEELYPGTKIGEITFLNRFLDRLVDKMPKDAALRLSTDGLKKMFDTAAGGSFDRDQTRVCLVPDSAGRGVYALVVMPYNRISEEMEDKLQRFFEDKFGTDTGAAERDIDNSRYPTSRYYCYIPCDVRQATISPDEINREVAEIVRSWDKNLAIKIKGSEAFNAQEDRALKLAEDFPGEYKEAHSPDDALTDIKNILSLSKRSPVKVALECEGGICRQGGPSTIALYSQGKEITITEAAPILQNAGFILVKEESFRIDELGFPDIYIQRFKVRPREGMELDVEKFNNNVGPGLARVFAGRAENDPLNSLMITAGLSLRSVELLRTLSSYLWQARDPEDIHSKEAIHQALAANPEAARLLHDMFEVKFNHSLDLTKDERIAGIAAMQGRLVQILREVPDAGGERVLSCLCAITENTVRTNYYSAKGAVAVKIRSENLDFIPQPSPKFEIFASSSRLEGVHLRHGMVSRGGIRWSGRPDDFRNEVLGLMQTQTTKNCFIVPDGSKGGFILKHSPADRAKLAREGEAAYREYITALLSVTDNLVDGAIFHPENLIIYDDDDPYLVVAADKGTANFSDIANEIASAAGFWDGRKGYWLADAFASGGTHGYGHKSLGITARGAWESVYRHFADLGIDPGKPFSVVGIGDMSGDVFGNGMLLNPNISLKAAFDHRHIFIDPNPDIKRTFAERQRLFALPRSSWDDFKRELISEGGGVFERTARAIKLTPQMRTVLSIPDDVPETVSGEELIQHILRARCDLLYNGGIGTYIKASHESNAEIHDSANDRVRVNAADLRARVVAEGGNLGFTKAARVEYARHGGRGNSDAIDNAAGVGLSDREVNYKIALAPVVSRGYLSEEERNSLLDRLAGPAVEAVLGESRRHNLLLTIGEGYSKINLGYFELVMTRLEDEGLLERKFDHLPDTDELQARRAQGTGLFRPELAACLAAVKIWETKIVRSSGFAGDDALQSFLLEYFPRELQANYRDELLAHPLRERIVAVEAANFIVDSLGTTFVHKTSSDYSAAPRAVIQNALGSELLLNTRELRASIADSLSGASAETRLEIEKSIRRAHRELASWLTSMYRTGKDFDSLLRRYQNNCKSYLQNPEAFLDKRRLEEYRARRREYLGKGITEEAAEKLAALKEIVPAFEIMRIAERSENTLKAAAPVYWAVIDAVGVYQSRNILPRIPRKDMAEHAQLVHAMKEMRRSAAFITRKLLKLDIGADGVNGRLRALWGYTDLKEGLEALLREPTTARLGFAAEKVKALDYQLSENQSE